MAEQTGNPTEKTSEDTAAAAAAGASGRSTAKAGKPGEQAEQVRPAEPTDDLATSRHQLQVGRRTLDYTATTGRVVLREEVFEDGTFVGHRPKAEVSLTSYVVDPPDSDGAVAGAGPNRRPVTFAFNGGPGSSSIWLHLGLLGPRRVVMGDVGALLPPPYGLVDNPESLLAESDLVLIDPVSTGYSRAVEGSKPEPFHGFEGDVESVTELVRLWTTRHARWMSPKFLLGESYGTLRAVAVAERLASRHGMYLNGLALISSVLDLSSVDFENQRNDRAHALYLPTYAAIAAYHGRLGRTPLRKAVAAAEGYAAGDYPWVLAQGDRIPAKDRAAAVKRVAALTGLSEEYVDRADLRIEHWRFFGELLRDHRLTVGRLDGRFTAPAASAIAEHMDADPSMDAIKGPYAAALNHYLRAELGYRSDLPYEQISPRVHPWSFRDFEGRPVDVTPQLERAMRANPHLQVHVGHGYLDGATPHFAAEDVLAHLRIPEDLRANIEHAYYEAGHMMYVHEPSRLQQSKDLAAFVTRASP